MYYTSQTHKPCWVDHDIQTATPNYAILPHCNNLWHRITE